MGRRRRAPRKARKGPGHNEANRRTRESRQKSVMLDGGVEHKLRYYAEIAFEEAEMPAETWRPLLQNLWARGSRQGVDEAYDYLDSKKEEGILDDKMHAKLHSLVRRYSTRR